jgi:hypothetical protein
MASKDCESLNPSSSAFFAPQRLRTIFFFALLFYQLNSVMAETDFFEDDMIPLDAGGFLYVFADIEKIRPIFDVIPVKELKSWQAVLVIDGTEAAAAALFPRDSGRLFQLVGWGNYPSFTARVALFLHKNWKLLHTNKGSYWFSNADRLSVRIAPTQIYTVSWRNKHVNPVPEDEGTHIPDGFLEFRNIYEEDAPLSLWMVTPGTTLALMLARERNRISIPAEMLFLNLYATEDGLYKAVVKMQFRNEEVAEDVAATMSSHNALPMTAAASGLGMLLFSNPPFVNGRNLYFHSENMTEANIASLMSLFIRYWR